MIAAALPALLVALLLGSGLYGIDLLCAGTLQEVTAGIDGKGGLIPVMLKAFEDPAGALPLMGPVAVGLGALLMANARLRSRPQMAIAITLLALAVPVLLFVVATPQVCWFGLSGQMLSLSYAGVTTALAGVIWLATRSAP